MIGSRISFLQVKAHHKNVGNSNPIGETIAMPRFVILEHDHPFLHWDFMLEDGAILKTWRLPAPPEVGLVLQATAIGDHRRDYLDHEGPLTGNRGQVKRWDGGTFEWLELSDDKLTIELAGRRLRGRASMQLAAARLWDFQLT
jgi:hypothetical protein